MQRSQGFWKRVAGSSRYVIIGGWTGILTLLYWVGINPLIRSELTTSAGMTFIRNLLFEVPAPPDIVLLTIDDDSLNLESRLFPEDFESAPVLELMKQFPWPRQVHAEATRLLLDAGAKAVVFDVVFSTPSAFGPDDDRQFQEVLKERGSQVVLAANYSIQNTGAGPSSTVFTPHPDIVDGTQTHVGYVNVVLEPSNNLAFKQIEDFKEQLNQEPVLPSLSEATLQALGQELDPSLSNSKRWIYYYSSFVPEIPYYWLTVPELRNSNLEDGQFFKDKIVIIGATAATLQDYQNTPIGRISGPQIQAMNLASILDSRSLQIIPPWFQLGLLGILGLGGGWILTAPKKLSWVIGLTLGGILIWSAGNFGVFVSRWVLPITVTGNLMIAGIGITEASRRAISDQLEKLRLRGTLDRYVSVQVANEIMNQRDEYENLLRGRKRHVAVLFTDIRGFTTLSNELPPEGLIPQLNDYLTEMVQTITEFQGCVDKFIGDAVMAEFGSPVSHGAKQDALNAVKAALKMREVLASLRQRWKDEGKPLFFTGIGINFGDAVAGNIGSQQRLEYTVIGDAVNLASRVESLTKELATDLIITQSVYELVSDEIETIPIGTRKIRGRGGETGLFQVVGLQGSGRELFDRVHREFLDRMALHAAKEDEESLASSLF